MIRWPIPGEWLAVLVVLLSCATASAQGDGAQNKSDKALARALFEDGRALMNEGDLDEACPKLAESFRLSPGGGTLLNLALCHEKQGKLATAWTEFNDALARAKRDDKPERVTFAEQHIEDLEPRLNRVTIELASGADLDGLTLTHNGAELTDAIVGTSFPVDGGRHVITASAPGRKAWKTTFELEPEGERREIVIPVLELAPDEGSGPSPKEDEAMAEASDDGSMQRTIGLVIGGVGIAATLVGTVFGVRALSLRGESDDKCGDGDACPDTPEGREGLAANEDAQLSASVANGLIFPGLGLIGVGLVVLLTAPSDDGDEDGAWITPHLSPTHAGVVLSGRF